MIANGAVTGAFSIIYLHASECYSTRVRSMAVWIRGRVRIWRNPQKQEEWDSLFWNPTWQSSFVPLSQNSHTAHSRVSRHMQSTRRHRVPICEYVFGEFGGCYMYIWLKLLIQGSSRITMLIIFGIISLIAAVCTALLPETTNLPLPETLADGEAFAR